MDNNQQNKNASKLIDHGEVESPQEPMSISLQEQRPSTEDSMVYAEPMSVTPEPMSVSPEEGLPMESTDMQVESVDDVSPLEPMDVSTESPEEGMSLESLSPESSHSDIENKVSELSDKIDQLNAKIDQLGSVVSPMVTKSMKAKTEKCPKGCIRKTRCKGRISGGKHRKTIKKRKGKSYKK
jgi:hypothetical protein